MSKHQNEFQSSAKSTPAIPPTFWIFIILEGIFLLAAVLIQPYSITENGSTHLEFRAMHSPLAANEKQNINVLVAELTGIAMLFGGSGLLTVIQASKARARARGEE